MSNHLKTPQHGMSSQKSIGGPGMYGGTVSRHSELNLPGMNPNRGRHSVMPTLQSGHEDLDRREQVLGGTMENVPPVVYKQYGWIVADKIGEGGFSKVCKAYNKYDNTNKEHAVKIIVISDKLQDWWGACLKREMRISEYLHHPHIIKIHRVLKTTRHGFIFMDFCPNGSIKDWLMKEQKELKAQAVGPNAKNRDLRWNGPGEKQIQKWFAQIVSAVEYIHAHDFAHRDLKLDNFLLDAELNAVLTDFGFACQTRKDTGGRLPIFANTHCGTPGYLAPEVAFPPYDAQKVDCWALGVVLFEFYTLQKPFRDGRVTEPSVWKAMWASRENPTYLSEIPEGTDPSIKGLIKGFLDPVDESRTTASQALEHPWVKKGSKTSDEATGGWGKSVRKVLSLGML